VTEVIGAYVSTLVNDGDTVQVGTGTLSSTMGGYLMEKKDLGIDSEILVASVIELIKHGSASGRYKTYRPGVATGSFIVPGADFDYCADNPKIELHDIAWCNNLARITAIRNLVAINQASMIDLTGQVASESIGPTMFTGPGGQLTWTMGALYSDGGRAERDDPARPDPVHQDAGHEAERRVAPVEEAGQRRDAHRAQAEGLRQLRHHDGGRRPERVLVEVVESRDQPRHAGRLRGLSHGGAFIQGEMGDDSSG
jgi:hypothetical protein